ARSCGDLLTMLQRQPDRDARSAANFARDRDVTAMLLDDLLDSGQSEASSEGFGAEERLKDLGKDIGWNAGTRVGDDDLDLSGHFAGTHVDPGFAAARDVRTKCLRRVVDQVDDDAAQALGIEGDGRATST